MLPAAPVAGLGDWINDRFEYIGDFAAGVTDVALTILGSPVTIAAEIAQRAGICDECAGKWTGLLRSLSDWTVELTADAIVEVVTEPRVWTAIGLAAVACLSTGAQTAGAGCLAAGGALTVALSIEIGESVKKTIEERARRGAEEVVMSLADRARAAAQAEGEKLVKSAAEEAGRNARAAAGDLLYALAPRALLDLLERGGADADRIVSASVAPLAELARRVAPLDPAAAAATVNEARVSARGAIMTAVRASIRNGQPVETTVRAALEPTLAQYSARLVADAREGAGRAIANLGRNLTDLSLAWDPQQVRAALVEYYAGSARSPGDPRRVAATAPIWRVALTARDLDGAPLARLFVSYTDARSARINAIAQSMPLEAIRTALRGRDRVSPDKPYPYADQAIRRYIETHAASVKPPMLNGRSNTAEALGAALAPGMAAALGVRVAAPVAAPVVVVRELDATRPDFAAQLADRVTSRRVKLEAAPSAGIPWGKVAIGLGALGLGYALTR
jgi:hypothetical protein